MLKHDYSKAIRSQLDAGMPFDRALAGLKSCAARRGHESLIPHILRDLARYYERRDKESVAEVRVATENDSRERTNDISNALAVCSCDGSPKIIIDDTIIGGYLIKYRDKLYDATHKKHLLTIFRALTK